MSDKDRIKNLEKQVEDLEETVSYLCDKVGLLCSIFNKDLTDIKKQTTLSYTIHE